MLFAVGLDARGRRSGVRAFATHPGSILTPLQRHLPRQEMVDAGWIDEDGNGVDPSFKTPEQGAATQVWAATSPQLADRGGVYCEDCDIARIADGSDTVPGGVRPYAIDDDAADRLWAASAGHDRHRRLPAQLTKKTERRAKTARAGADKSQSGHLDVPATLRANAHLS